MSDHDELLFKLKQDEKKYRIIVNHIPSKMQWFGSEGHSMTENLETIHHIRLGRDLVLYTANMPYPVYVLPSDVTRECVFKFEEVVSDEA